MPPTPKPRRAVPQKLPRGRHGIPREDVIRHQRERLFAAVIDASSELGYVKMSVEDICQRSGISRRTFYDLFPTGKESVFLATYDDIVAQVTEKVLAAFALAEGFVARARGAVAAFLDFLAARPDVAQMCIVEVMAAGPEAIERRNAFMQSMAQLILRAADDDLPKRGRPPELVAETIVGGVYEVIYSRTLQGQAAELPGLLPDLLFSLLMPYIGHEAAADEARRLRRRSKSA